MKKNRFAKAACLVLACATLLCALPLTASAAEGSTTTKTTAEIRAMLNTDSYEEYTEDAKDVPAATSEFVVDATQNFTYETSAGVKVDPNATDLDEKKYAHVATYDGVDALYCPDNGTVTWELPGFTDTAKYSIVLKYYPVEGKPASVERIFMINGSVPFSEARYITLSKNWENVYPDGVLTLKAGESADSYIAKAAEYGITATAATVDGKNVVSYKIPDVWVNGAAEYLSSIGVRFFTSDIDRNEIRASMAQVPEWKEYELRDSNGFYAETFEFVVGPDEETGKTTISMRAVNEPMAIAEIRLIPHKSFLTYADYLKQFEGEKNGTDAVRMEAEYFSSSSSQTVYPVGDNTSAITSPSSASATVLNTIGGEKWETAGQWVAYTFKVKESGMYSINTRYKQSVLDGMFTSRVLYLYSDGAAEGDKGYYNGIPFSEATKLRFEYDNGWLSGPLTDGETQFKFYFEKDVTYTIRLEVCLGSMGDIVSRVQASLDHINEDYLNIIKLTGADPDEDRDYGFARIMMDTMIDMIIQSEELYAVAREIAAIAGNKSSMTATLEKIAYLLDTMGKDEENIAKNVEQLKTQIGTLGTWLGDAKTQPLMLDLVTVQSPDAKAPKAKANFIQAVWFEIKNFFGSFFRNYSRMGAMEEIDEKDSVEVWLAYGRDQSQVIRGLINNDFTPETGVAINLKLVAGGTLLPSILAGRGPDAYIGLGQADVINYAIRGALLEIEDMEGYDECVANFNDAAMIVLQMEDADGKMHTYGVPETQTFNMMFVREDILADLDIEIPKTWDDVLAAIPTLQANNMQIGMHTDYKIFLYQRGGELFADNGMRINLDSNVALESFEFMCNLYTMYSFPYSYDFANRFRTGEMPIGFAAYTGTYNQLKVFATEIEGLWAFYPMPGYSDDEGNINNVSVSTVSAIVMIVGCKDPAKTWEFMKWHAGADCQVDYSNEMVAILGPSAKHSTANKEALASMPWTSAEYEQLAYQFNSLASIPNYPGYYIIDRYTKFAFLDAYNDNADPVTGLQSYINIINKEITRKRNEFGLETLAEGQTLASKRLNQAWDEITSLKGSSSWKAEWNALYERIEFVFRGGEGDDFAAVRALADTLTGYDKDLFAKAVQYMNEAADCLEVYESYK